MASFQPPTDKFVVWALREEMGIFAHLQPGDRGRNVYKLTNGTYTEHHPGSETEIEITYHGGHVHTLTTEEESDLIAAGYGAYIS
jgi:hypothetical protein